MQAALSAPKRLTEGHGGAGSKDGGAGVAVRRARAVHVAVSFTAVAPVLLSRSWANAGYEDGSMNWRPEGGLVIV